MNVMPLSNVMGGLVKKITGVRGDLEKTTSAGRFAGTWAGTMSFANSSGKSEIVLTITKGVNGEACAVTLTTRPMAVFGK